MLPGLVPSSRAGPTPQRRGEVPRPPSLPRRLHCHKPSSLWAWLSAQFSLTCGLRTEGKGGGKDEKLISLPRPHAGNNCFASSRTQETRVTLEKGQASAIEGHCYRLLSVCQGKQWRAVCARTMLCVISHFCVTPGDGRMRNGDTVPSWVRCALEFMNHSYQASQSWERTLVSPPKVSFYGSRGHPLRVVLSFSSSLPSFQRLSGCESRKEPQIAPPQAHISSTPTLGFNEGAPGWDQCPATQHISSRW